MATFPILFGLASFGGNEPDKYYQLLKGLQGIGGYSDDDDSNRMLETRAEAVAAAVPGVEIEKALQQGFPQSATECLLEWEQLLGLQNNASRNIEERQRRIIACKSATSKTEDIFRAINILADEEIIPMGFEGNMMSFDDINFVNADERYVLYETDYDDGEYNNYHWYDNIRDNIVDDDAEDDTIYQKALELDNEYYEDVIIRNGAVDILKHVMPARTRGDKDSFLLSDVVVHKVGARWNTGDLDKEALRQQIGTEYDHVRPVSRIKSYGPLSKIKSDDLNKIQDNILFGLASESSVMSDMTAGSHWVIIGAASGIVANGNTDTVDDSIDWRDRLVTFIIRWEFALSPNCDPILPGLAYDHLFNGYDMTVASAYLGTGGVSSGYQVDLGYGTIEITFYADSSTGDLMVEADDTNDISFCGIAIASMDTGER